MKKAANALSVFITLILLTLSFANPARAQMINGTFSVNTTADTNDANVGNGVCADASGQCSLRAAMEEAKHLFYDHAIETDISFGLALPATIFLSSSLPLDSPANIIGPNDLSLTIDGQNIAGIGIDLSSSSSTTIKNLRLQHFTFAAISTPNYFGSDTIENNIIINNAMRGIQISGQQTVATAGSISILNNYIGFDPISGEAAPNGTYGIDLYAENLTSTGATINISGNTISGNESCGISIISPDIDTNTIIQGNKIGTDDSGTLARPNSGGICVSSHAGLLTIGGDTAAEGNLISGNTNTGIEVRRAVNFIVQFNNLSTNASGTGFLPNGGEDIYLYESNLGSISDNVALQGITIPGTEATPVTEVSILRNYIGITRTGFVRPPSTNQNGIYAKYLYQDSQIGFNRITGFRTGINIAEGTFVNITSNRIFDISGLGIDIAPWNRINPNDYLDADQGPNNMQNFPALTVEKTDFGTYQTYDITAKLHSTPNTTFRVEIFSSDVCFAGGYGEGEEMEKFSNAVQTDSNGNATWQVPKIYSWDIVGEFFTATASKFISEGVYGSTSEFSRQIEFIYLPAILR